MTKYEERKNEVREEAIEYQYDFGNHNYSYLECANHTEHFYKLGKRYGLLREFRENGII